MIHENPVKENDGQRQRNSHHSEGYVVSFFLFRKPVHISPLNEGEVISSFISRVTEILTTKILRQDKTVSIGFKGGSSLMDKQ